MKKFLIALNILIWSVVWFEVAHAEPSKVKPTVTKQAAKKPEAPKAPPSAVKPTPKKKAETK
jgi:hypothetical protein